MALANVNVTSTPAGTIGGVQTPVSTSTFTPAGDVHTLKIPVTVVMVTGLSLVIVNNSKNGKLSELWDLIWNGKTIPELRKDTYTLVGEVVFVLIVSFMAQISAAISDIAFALFVSLWIVWAVNNPQLLSTMTENIRQSSGQPPLKGETWKQM